MLSFLVSRGCAKRVSFAFGGISRQRTSTSTSRLELLATRSFASSQINFDPAKATPNATVPKTPSATTTKLTGKSKPTAKVIPTKKKPTSKPKKVAKKPAAKKPKKIIKKKVVKAKPAKAPEPVLLFTPKPKAPLTPWFRYLAEHRDPTKSIVEQAKLVSEEWRTLLHSAKEVYIEQSAKDREAYQKELADWKAAQSPEALAQYRKLHRKAFRKKKEARETKLGISHLKPPSTAFMMFFKDLRANPAQYGITEEQIAEGAKSMLHIKSAALSRTAYLCSTAGTQWRDMTLGQKATWVAAYQEQKVKYEKDVMDAMAAKISEKA